MEWRNRSAYVFIKTHQGKTVDIWKKFHTWDNVIGTWIVTGDWDVIVWFDAHSWDDIHNCIAEIKKWEGVEWTSSHMVYHGFKNGGWWWEKPAGTWVMAREHQLEETAHKLKNWDWTTSGASIPGDWDYITWIAGENWDDVWNHVTEFNSQNWETSTLVPVRSWWNQNWKDKWW
jgi:hypothetical protein